MNFQFFKRWMTFSHQRSLFCHLEDFEKDRKADLRKFSFNYTRQGNEESALFIWRTRSPDVVVNVDFTQEGMEGISLNEY